ncbi:NAD(P)-dependent oxidoreductase [Variovorax sp. J22R133]|uniref:NAD(P)-dependent oxidoreductase n=1 Tax=Variovorax brevis TaxID=3053503 RepID=UPI002577BBBC|nr:NAD(P)-dependent oxidoreductase [Variovorax sp. J22R133]MDM0116269.1 NAD(P)-dependent oxidoreductase [Variovorax sp. J22R133]
MKVGYIGLGNMGSALAARLQLGHELLVYDANTAAVQKMVMQGAVSATSLSDVGQQCDIILMCLPTSDIVRTVIFGADGLLGSLREGTLLVDQTSGDPMATRAMAAELALRGVELIDAPVSGGPTGARAGNIAIMLGATKLQYEKVLPLLQTISPNIFHAGDVGAGHVAKLANNLVSAAQRFVTMECMALAVKNGVGAETIVDIMTAGAARNFYLEKLVRPHVLSGKLASNFTLGLLYKDIRQACQLGMDSNVTMLFGNLTKEFLQMTINEHSPETQVYATALVMDRLAGTHVVPENHSLT